MEPHLLRTFLAVADTGSFSVAAQRLGYTQSAVSQQIATLEADLGTALLTRRPVALTEAGHRLRGHASLILARLAARARVLSGVATGTLDLGLIDGYAAPSDPLRLPDAGLAEAVTGGVGAVAIAEHPVVVALPSNHPLARRRGLALTDLAEAYWMDAPAITPLAELRQATGLDGLRPGLRYEGADVAVLTGPIAAGHGLSLLPSSVAATAGGLAGVPVRAPRLVHRVELLARRATYRDAGRAPGDGDPTARLAAMLAQS